MNQYSQKRILPTSQIKVTPPTQLWNIITVSGVVKLLQSINPKKAIGPDLVPSSILKDYAEILGPVLKNIFQQSLDTGEVPDDWTKANITAIFKKGNKSNPANYKPVSLTSVTCKILKHIVFSNIMTHSDLLSVTCYLWYNKQCWPKSRQSVDYLSCTSCVN